MRLHVLLRPHVGGVLLEERAVLVEPVVLELFAGHFRMTTKAHDEFDHGEYLFGFRRWMADEAAFWQWLGKATT